MLRTIALLALLLLLPFASSYDDGLEENRWSVDLENGYISTKPLIADGQVFVRTSGFWTGEDRPHVYAFNLVSGEENWRFKNLNSTQHDMSPLLYVPADSSSCGEWPDLLIVGWTDGTVTALNAGNGSLHWSAQTEVETWGITGSMALDDGLVVVPTRQGLSSFCLSDGDLELRVDLPQLGWRNGVTVTPDYYMLGNEEGILNTISRSGQVSNLTIGEGKIRHPPLHTSAGTLIHLQTSSGSTIYLGNQTLSNEGHSPAIPLQVGSQVYLGASEYVIHLRCESTCIEQGRSEFHTNGEITAFTSISDESMIAFPRNTLEGGWGVGLPGENITVIHDDIGTYTTAGFGQGPSLNQAFGNDNGVLHVVVYSSGQDELESDSEPGSTIFVRILAAIVFSIIIFIVSGNKEMTIKVGLVAMLVVLVPVLPDMSALWSEQIEDLVPESDESDNWDDSWPDDWKGTQVVVFELESGDVAIGGLSDFDNVEELTDFAAGELQITIEKEDHQFGPWIKSFNGEKGDGWEFYIDGKRSMVGISEAELKPNSVVEWRMT
jgi:hypothetical protein